MSPLRFQDFLADWAYQSADAGWRFDLISFAIGLTAALVLIGILYRYQRQLAHLRDQLQQKAHQLRERLTASVAARYSASAIETAQTMHLLNALAPLDQIYVETKLCALSIPAESKRERPILDPFQAIQAGGRLMILGQAGSGRTTLLNHLLLLQAGRLHAAGEQERVPLYVYLPALPDQLPDVQDVMGDKEPDKKDAALAKPLAQAAVASMSSLEARGAARWLRGQVESGNALILLDGWDEIPSAEQKSITAWIERLADAFPENRLVVVAGDYGYAPLVQAGFVSLRPVPWTRQKLDELATRWAQSWPQEKTEAQVTPPHLSYRLRPLVPLEATVELALRLHKPDQKPANTPAGRMAQFLNLILPHPQTDDQGHVAWPLKTGHRALGRLALTTLRRGNPMLEREEIQSTVAEAMPSPGSALESDERAALSKEEQRSAREEEERRTLQVVDCCRALTARGAPIKEWGDRRYHIVHPLLTAYLAARHLATEGDAEDIETLRAHLDDPAWLDLLRFYVGLAPAAPFIEQLTSAQDDLLLNHLWTATALLVAAPPGQGGWRSKLMSRLAQILMNSRMPALLRQRALTGLVESDQPGVSALLKKAINHPDQALRAWAVSGLGALGREQDLDLFRTTLSDEALEVRLASVKALGRLAQRGNETALELIVAALIETEDQVQRVAAEILAHLGGEGHAVLQDAAQDADLIIRRAATYGLAEVDASWAQELLVQMQREDDEWLVRNAATEALSRRSGTEEDKEPPPKLTVPRADAEPWLIAWAAERGEGTGVGDAALETLAKALREGDPSIRRKAVETLGRLADPRTVGFLRQSLRDPDPSVREAALAALDEISHRHDVTLTMKKS